MAQDLLSIGVAEPRALTEPRRTTELDMTLTLTSNEAAILEVAIRAFVISPLVLPDTKEEMMLDVLYKRILEATTAEELKESVERAKADPKEPTVSPSGSTFEHIVAVVLGDILKREIRKTRKDCSSCTVELRKKLEGQIEVWDEQLKLLENYVPIAQ